jgi:hypothetical protein
VEDTAVGKENAETGKQSGVEENENEEKTSDDDSSDEEGENGVTDKVST